MNILIIQDTDWIRRNPYQQVHLAERLSKKGHKILVIDYEILWAEEGDNELISKRQIHKVSRIIKDSNITVIRPSIIKIPILDYISMLYSYRKEIKKQIHEFKPDIILGNDILTTFLAYRLAKKYKIKTIFYSIDIDYKLIPYHFLQSIGKLIESWNIRSADIVLSINEGLREYTIRMGAKKSKTQVVRAGIDLDKFNLNYSGDEIRKKYGIKTKDKVLFFIGWLYHFSGLKELSIELSKIKEKNIKLMIVGDGDAFDDLKKIQEEYHLNKQIILTGRQDYNLLPNLLAAADICLLPAYNNEIMRYIVPIKTYEYMAMENPIVSTELPGMMREFGDGNGVIYANSPESVLYKSLELFEKGKYKELGKKARKYVESNSWEKITNEFEKILLNSF